jgi:2-phospho-L-lactate/phosphoenolpyruvate guanylyltransferase
VIELWAVVPVKERERAKERLASLLPPAARQALALAMLEDVLTALAAARGLGGIAVSTIDAAARRLAQQFGARIIAEGARDGHTGAVAAAAGVLAAEGCDAMLTVPGDIPLVTADEIEAILNAHRPSPAFTIVPSHDERGSNAILVSPPDAVPLRFGEDSFFPHLRAAEALGILPTVLRLPGVALDIDNPADLDRFLQMPAATRTRAFLDEIPIFAGVPPVAARR